MLLYILFQVFVKEAVWGSEQAQTYFREKGLVKKNRKRTILRYGIVPYLDMMLIIEKSKICNHIVIWHWCYLSKKCKFRPKLPRKQLREGNILVLSSIIFSGHTRARSFEEFPAIFPSSSVMPYLFVGLRPGIFLAFLFWNYLWFLCLYCIFRC